MEVLPEEVDVGQDWRVDVPQELNAEVVIPAEVGQRVVVVVVVVGVEVEEAEDVDEGVNSLFFPGGRIICNCFQLLIIQVLLLIIYCFV